MSAKCGGVAPTAQQYYQHALYMMLDLPIKEAVWDMKERQRFSDYYIHDNLGHISIHKPDIYIQTRYIWYTQSKYEHKPDIHTNLIYKQTRYI